MTSSPAPQTVAGGSAGPDLLRVNDIAKSYAGVQALAGVSLEVKAGEILTLVGENGSGKSTLIKIVAGVETADAGTVLIDGQDWTGASPIQRIEAGVQIIYQDFALFPNLSAAENVWLPQQQHGRRRIVDRAAGLDAARKALDAVGASFDLHRMVEALPVSQKQLVAIARALVHEARLLVMDEPTTALTHREVEQLFTVIRRLSASGMGFIFVSHKLHEIAEICERVVVLRNGRKTLDSPIEGLAEADIAQAMTGREISTARYSRPAPNTAAPLLEVSGLSRAGEYRDVGFSLARGEILGLAGLMGVGRTALAKGLFGLPPAEHGRIVLDGRELAIRNVSDAVAAGIGYVPEDRLNEGLFLDYSIGDNIVVRALDRLLGRGGWIDRSRKREEVARWIERLAIKTPSGDLAVSTLSGGNQQRVVLAKWIASNPRLLILNRPTVGVDVGSKAGIHDIIVDLAAHGIGIIVISDDLPEIMRICDRTLAMRGGVVIAERRVEDTTEEELMALIGETGA